MLAYLCFRLLIGAQPRLEDRAADRIRDHLEGLLNGLLFYGVDLACVRFIFSATDHFSYGKFNLFVVEKDMAESLEPRHCLYLRVYGMDVRHWMEIDTVGVYRGVCELIDFAFKVQSSLFPTLLVSFFQGIALGRDHICK